MKFSRSDDQVSDPRQQALKYCRTGIIAVAAASALVNILYLTSSFFMLQVYDRVIPSRSIPSLIALSILALLLYAFQGGFEVMRGRLLVRMSGVLDEMLGKRVFKTMIKSPIRGQASDASVLRDFDQIRAFITSSGPAAFFDLPWLPLYLIICFLFHPLIGYMALAGMLVLMVLTYLTNRSAQATAKKVYELGSRKGQLAEASFRNAESIHAMGMAEDLAAVWSRHAEAHRQVHRHNSDVTNAYAVLSKIFRIALQSAVLAAGAVLVIENQASGGIIIASSILTSRALAPVEQAIASWNGFAGARQAWRRLNAMLAAIPEGETPLALPAPKSAISVEMLSSGPPAGAEPIVVGVNFSLKAGSGLGVIGPSASGKSSLARAIVGLWPCLRGAVRLDGAMLDQWDDEALGKHVGFMPQAVELFSGSVADNISRFRRDASDVDIIAAAEAAGVHEMILRLPNGYQTEIGNGGAMLSAGQRQRVALARALFGDPFLVVLDEPNSNLDAEGEAALTEAILGIRRRGGIVIVIAHRPSALAGVDHVLMMRGGRQAIFGPKDEVLAQVVRPDAQPAIEKAKPLKVAGSFSYGG